MSVVSLDSPGQVMHRLAEIENDLATRQNGFEAAARDWHAAQVGIRRSHAEALLSSTKPSVAEKRAEAELAAVLADGAEHEALYEASKAVIRVLETRATVLMSVLKAMGRA